MLILLISVWSGPVPAAERPPAQQPTQRVLPAARPAVPGPQERTVCLPELDPDLKRYVQPCRTVSPDDVPPDRAARDLARAVARAAGPYWSDLDKAMQAAYAALARPRPHVSQQVSREEFTASREAWTRYLEALTVPADLPLSPPPASPSSPSMLGPHSTRSVSDGSRVVPPAKSSFLPPAPAAPPVWDNAAAGVSLGTPWTWRFAGHAGDQVYVIVRQVTPELGALWPDPVVWLIRLDEPGAQTAVATESTFRSVRTDPETGRMAALADDGPDGLPRLEATLTEHGSYRVVIAPYAPRTSGFAFVEAGINGQIVMRGMVRFRGVPWHVAQLAPGDLVFAGAAGHAGAYDHDAMLLLLPAPWAAGQTAYAASNNDLDLLPLLRVTEVLADYYLVVASAYPEGNPAVRVVVSRAGNADPAVPDADGDLLSADVEAVLGTCDVFPAAAIQTEARIDHRPSTIDHSAPCPRPDPCPEGWTPADTDNDGFTDFEELYGVRRCYPRPAAAPFFRVPRCLESEAGGCLQFCPAEAGLVAAVPLSALAAPDPTKYDLYVEYDWWAPEGAPAGQHRLTPAQLRTVRRAFRKDYVSGPTCPDPADCFRPAAEGVRLHFYQDEGIPASAGSATAHIPAASGRYLFFDLFLTPDRKYTNTFHYVVGTPKGAGQSDVAGRAAMVGAPESPSGPARLVHEMGHLFGLMHHHDSANPSNSPFYPSIMSYGYSNSLPPPIDWDGDFRPCGRARSCPGFFKCVDSPAGRKVCAPDCGLIESGPHAGTDFPHFSTGELQLPVETSEEAGIPETGYPRWFLPYLYCYADERKGLNVQDRIRRFNFPACAGGRCVQCDADACAIDWDRDGQFTVAQGFDLDRDGEVREIALGDRDDLRRIVDLARSGLKPMAKNTVAAYYTDLENGALNVLPYPAVVEEGHGGLLRDVTNRCDEYARWRHCRNQDRQTAALFRGPASRDRSLQVRFRPDFCLPTTEGLAVSLRAKPMALPAPGVPVTLFDSEPLKLLLQADREEGARWVARVATTGGPVDIALRDPDALGRWSRVTLIADRRERTVKFFLRRGTTVLDRTRADLRVQGTICALDIGAAAGAVTGFTGLLDDPMVITGPVPEL